MPVGIRPVAATGSEGGQDTATAMIVLAYILLALAALLTLLVTQFVPDAHPVGGADAMGLMVVTR